MTAIIRALFSFLASLFARRSSPALPSAAPPPPLDTPPAPSTREPIEFAELQPGELSPWSEQLATPVEPDKPTTFVELPPTPPTPVVTRPSTPSALAAEVEDRRFRAATQGGARSQTNVIVIHSTEGGTAAGAATWFARKGATGSTHVIVDDGATFRTVEDDRIAYGAHPFNRDGMHIEITGFAKWSRSTWLQHDAMLRRAARVIASWVRKYEIPLRLLDDAELLGGPSAITRGITTHAAIVRSCGHGKPGNLACGGAGDHWDPGPDFPIDVLLQYVAELLDVEVNA